MKKKINFSIPFSKVDEEQRTVTGIATAEVLDKQNEIVDYEASKKAFGEWSGNIREMHGDKAVAKNIQTQFDDENKAVIITAKVSESADGENAWIKIKEGILTGYSIGGSVFEIEQEVAKNDKGQDIDARRIKAYDLAETSFVDSPACPVAEFLVVKSEKGEDGKVELIETERMIEHPKPIPVLGWQKTFVYSIAQYNEMQKQKTEETEVKEFEQYDEFAKATYSDKERKAMADKGHALPDGSFPIANVADLKNAVKAIGRAKDPAKAKAHIKARAKDLGATAEIPDSWKTNEADDLNKADEENKDEQPPKAPDSEENQPPKPQDGEGEENNKPEGEEQKVDEKPVEGKKTPEAGDEQKPPEEQEKPPTPPKPETPPADPEKADKSKDIRKDLYTVGSLADCLSSLTSIRDWCVMEQEWEGDDSTVPADLTAAIENLGGILQAMATEEVAEAVDNKTGTPAAPLALADQGADLKKIEANMLETTQTLLDKQAELIFGKVAELVAPLADRVNALSNQPAVGDRPVASYVEVDKGVGASAPTDPIADQNSALSARWTELKKIATERKDDPNFSLSERQKLVDEMWSLNKKINHVETKDLNPALVSSHPYAFKRLS